MKQASFSDVEHDQSNYVTRREKFLAEMDSIIPWSAWEEKVRPYYPAGDRGRPTVGIGKMLRMYMLQIWFSMSDKGTEEAIYDSNVFRRFVGVDIMGGERVPDATTLLKFRHLLEQHDIGNEIFEDVKKRLDEAGLMMHGGTVVDATIVAAPSSTKNADKQRDGEMHSVKKGNQWHFGMKIHAGSDAGSGYTHTITATSGNVHDLDEAHNLIRPDDEVVYGDSGYLGVEKREEIIEDEHLSQVEYRINKRPSSCKMSKDYKGINWDKVEESGKSRVRCRVEHPFLIVKKQFGYAKVVYKGIAKNLHRFFVLFASANLVMCLRAGRRKKFCSV